MSSMLEHASQVKKYHGKTMVNVPWYYRGVLGSVLHGNIRVYYHGKTMVNVPWYYRGVLGSVLPW